MKVSNPAMNVEMPTMRAPLLCNLSTINAFQQSTNKLIEKRETPNIPSEPAFGTNIINDEFNKIEMISNTGPSRNKAIFPPLLP